MDYNINSDSSISQKKDLTTCDTFIACNGWYDGTTTNPNLSCEKAFLRKNQRNLNEILVMLSGVFINSNSIEF